MAQLVEQRIRNAWVAGSSPAIGSHCIFIKAELAQLVEHWLPKPRVAGSSPVFRSKKKKKSFSEKSLEKICKVQKNVVPLHPQSRRQPHGFKLLNPKGRMGEWLKPAVC